jgi:hypothetical protein
MAIHCEIAAHRIPVSLFREILIWPLALHLPENELSAGRLVQDEVDRIARNPRWRPVDDPIEHIPRPPVTGNAYEQMRWKADTYAEGVYFHEFVQSFLFASHRQAPDDRSPRDTLPFRLFRRPDVSHVDIDLEGNRSFRLKVERLNLYLFRGGSAVLVLEMSNEGQQPPAAWRLADVLDIHDLFRRTYAPYARVAKDGSLGLPLLVAHSVTWRAAGGDASFDLLKHDVARGMVTGYSDAPLLGSPDFGRRFPPVFRHWRWLLGDALPLAPEDRPCVKRGRWHQVVDERMPTIATVSVCEGENGDSRFYFDRTRRADLVLLCFADNYKDARREYPYDPGFLQDFEKKHVYDRFRQDGTRYLASGYAFVAYGARERNKDGWSFFEDVIATHMRRHYFQMGLLAHFELAALLTFSSRISRAVETHDSDAEGFEARVEAIEDEFLQFIHCFRFTGVSNQLQAHELFELWRRHLRAEYFGHDNQMSH